MPGTASKPSVCPGHPGSSTARRSAPQQAAHSPPPPTRPRWKSPAGHSKCRIECPPSASPTAVSMRRPGAPPKCRARDTSLELQLCHCLKLCLLGYNELQCCKQNFIVRISRCLVFLSRHKREKLAGTGAVSESSAARHFSEMSRVARSSTPGPVEPATPSDESLANLSSFFAHSFFLTSPPAMPMKDFSRRAPSCRTSHTGVHASAAASPTGCPAVLRSEPHPCALQSGCETG